MTAATSDFEQFKVDGINATWIPLMNPDTNLAILAVWVPIGDEPENPDFTWTLKMTCKADQVDLQYPAQRDIAGDIHLIEIRPRDRRSAAI